MCKVACVKLVLFFIKIPFVCPTRVTNVRMRSGITTTYVSYLYLIMYVFVESKIKKKMYAHTYMENTS